MVINEPINNEPNRIAARPVRESYRDERASPADLSQDAAASSVPFSTIMANIGSDWGASLGLRSVERDLNGQMFEPAPKDARSAQKAQANEALAASDFRDGQARAKYGAQQQVNHAAESGSIAPSGHLGGASADATDENRAAFNIAEQSSRTSRGPNAAGDSSISQIAGSRSDSVSATSPEFPRRAQDSTFGTIEVTSIAGTAASAQGVPRAAATSTGSNTNVAQQLARVLQTNSTADTVSARAVSSSQEGQPAPKLEQAGKEQVRAENPMRSSDKLPHAKETGPVSEPTPFDELVRSIRLRVKPDFSSARIRLDPPDLGHVRVDFRLGDDRLELNVQTESAEAARRVQSRVEALKAALEHHGIRVDRADVRVEVIETTNSGDPVQGATHGAPNETYDHGDASREQSERRSVAFDKMGVDPLTIEVDPGAFWNRAAWSGIGQGRVDVRI